MKWCHFISTAQHNILRKVKLEAFHFLRLFLKYVLLKTWINICMCRINYDHKMAQLSLF